MSVAVLEKRAIQPMSLRRPSLLKLRARLTRTLAKFLHGQARHLADQINLARARLGKADLTPDEIDAVEAVLAELHFSGWSILVGDVQPIMAEIAKDGAYAALAQIHFDTEAAPGVEHLVNDDAVDYAEERAAEMVGMRRLESGRLIENPEAKWQITEATRDGLRQYVTSAIAEGWSNDRLADEVGQAYAFSDERAMVIARTETSKASNAGALSGYQASGVVEQKIWLTAEDDKVDEEECAPNGEQGAIDLGDAFQSGDQAPPAHPNCRCVLAPVLAPNTAPAEGDEE